jgi:hypothetical protein
MYDGVKDRNFDLIFQGIAFFIILADSFGDEEAREGIAAFISTITSTEDFITWIEYFGLADDEIKTGDIVMANFIPQEQLASAGALSFFVSDANAGLISGSRGLIQKLFKRLKPLVKDPDDAKFLLRGIRQLVLVVKKKTLPQFQKAQATIRANMFNKSMLYGMLSIAKRGSFKNFRNWMLGYAGQRISPLTLIVTTSYIETMMSSGELFPEDQHEYDRKRNRKELNRLYREAVPSTFSNFDQNKASGASYHLLQIAYIHAINGAPLLGIEVQRNIPVLPSVGRTPGVKQDWRTSQRFNRKVDIVTGSELGVNETWWETKSLVAVSDKNRAPAGGIKNWKFLQNAKDKANEKAFKASRTHRQFSLDRIARKQNVFQTNAERIAKGLSEIGDVDAPTVVVKSANWNIHKFRTEKIQSERNRRRINASRAKLEKLLEVRPDGSGRNYAPQAAAPNPIAEGGGAQLLNILKIKGVELAEEAAKDLIADGRE